MNYFFDYLRLTILKALKLNLNHRIKLAGYTVHFGSIKHLKLLFKEIFVKENYQCDIGDSPNIIDGGANIGLAILYFKKKYPKANIIAFEPNPESFEYLKKNVEENKLKGVQIYNAALSDHEGTISFYTSTDMPLADVGASTVREHVDYHHAKKGQLVEVSVESKALSPFIDKKIDLLKIDIEGSEGLVFKEINGNFHFIENSIMEYHYNIADHKNHLSDIIKTFEKNNHVYNIDLIGKPNKIKNVNGYIIKSRKA